MLSTAVVLICDIDGSRRVCRALLDCGSQANFVSKKFVEALCLETRPLNVSISGVNGTVTLSNHVVRIKLQLRLNSYTVAIECIDQVTDKIPAVSSGQDKFNFPRNIRLADFTYRHIDLLIGVVLESDMRWSSQVFRQAPNSSENTTELDFDGSFGQHHIDRFKSSLVSRVRIQCEITRTYQSCLANGRHLCAIGQLDNREKYVRDSLFRQRVSKFSG